MVKLWLYQWVMTVYTSYSQCDSSLNSKNVNGQIFTILIDQLKTFLSNNTATHISMLMVLVSDMFHIENGNNNIIYLVWYKKAKFNNDILSLSIMVVVLCLILIKEGSLFTVSLSAAVRINKTGFFCMTSKK